MPSQPTTTFERAIRCIVALNLRPSARWSGDTEAMTRIILRDPALHREAVDLPRKSPNYALGRNDPETLAKAMIVIEFSDSLARLTRLGPDPMSQLPSDEEIRRTCQALARSYG
jgi:hypothetical protein